MHSALEPLRRTLPNFALLLGLALTAPAAAEELDLRELFSRLPQDEKLGKVLGKAMAEQLVKAHDFEVQLNPDLTPAQFLKKLAKHGRRGVRPASERKVQPLKAPAGLRAAAPGTALPEIPRSYNFFTAKATKRCLYDGPFDQFGGTCWAHAAAAAASAAICKAESEAGAKIDVLSYWLSPQQFVSCLDAARPGPGFDYTTPYGDGFWSDVAINEFVEAKAPLVDLARCAPAKGCSFGEWNKDDICEAAATRFPRCVSADQPVCAGTNGAVPKRNRVRGAFPVEVDADPKKTAAAMQRAMLQYGPLLVSMQVFDDLSIYGGGIYRHQKPKAGWSTDHAVVLYGWGEEPVTGRKYWLMMNSWGKDLGVKVDGAPLPSRERDVWQQLTDLAGLSAPPPASTEGGFYKIARGENMVGIESYPSYVDAGPVLATRDLALTLARPSSPAILSTWQLSDDVKLAQLSGDAWVEVDFYLPAELLRMQRPSVEAAFVRVYAQTCSGGLEVLVPGRSGWQVAARQSCAAGGNVQQELEVSAAVLAAIQASPVAPPATSALFEKVKAMPAGFGKCPAGTRAEPVKCIRPPCPPRCVPTTAPAEWMPPKVTVRLRAAPGGAVAVRLARDTRAELFPGNSPPPPERSQNPDEDYVAPPAYTWPPTLVALAVKTEAGAENVARQFFPRLRFELTGLEAPPK